MSEFCSRCRDFEYCQLLSSAQALGGGGTPADQITLIINGNPENDICPQKQTILDEIDVNGAASLPATVITETKSVAEVPPAAAPMQPTQPVQKPPTPPVIDRGPAPRTPQEAQDMPTRKRARRTHSTADSFIDNEVPQYLRDAVRQALGAVDPDINDILNTNGIYDQADRASFSSYVAGARRLQEKNK